MRGARSRLFAGLIGLSMVASAGLLVLTPTAAPAAARVLTVTPATDLAGQVVRVSWAGFTPTDFSGGNSVIVLQCKQDPTSLADCFTGDPFPAVAEGTRQIGRTAGDGTGAVLFEVRPAAKLPELACSASSPCSVLAYENDGVSFPTGSLPTSAVTASLEFAPSQADCPPVSTFDLRADGEASAAPLFYRWAAARCTGDKPLILDFTETSANLGRDNALSKLVDIGITSESARPEERAAHPNAGTFTYAPTDLTAVTIVINMKDPFTGNRLEDVVITPRLVARLITDSDVAGFLSDPELRTLNPGVRFPTVAASQPLLRAERNADTRLLTTWVSKDPAAKRFLANQDDWGAGLNPAYNGYSYPQDLFENVGQSGQFLPRTGQEQVALRMFYAVQPNGTQSDRTDEIGFVGIVDLPTANRFGLPTAKIVNASGTAVAPTESSILAGYRAMIKAANGTLVTATQPSDPDAYPLVKVDYAMVPDALAPEAKRAKMSSFLGYVAGAGQASLPPGYVALPDDLRDQTKAVAKRFEPVATPATTTTTTTAPTNTDGSGDYSGTGSGYLGGDGSASGGDGSGGFVDGGDLGGSDAGGVGGKGTKTTAGTKTVKGGIAADAEARALPMLPISRATAIAPVMLVLAGVALLWWALGGLGSSLRRRGASA